MRSNIPAAIAALLPFPLFSSAADTISSKDIISTAESAGQLATLVAALKAAELTDTLKGAGPFTLLAPTDAAFAKLGAGAVQTWLKPENKDELLGNLAYHVIPANLKAASAMTMSSAKTLNGQSVTLILSGRAVKINDATVLKADIAVSNGIIHIIDTVLIPN